ncbi:hypothetical protein BDZ97DRAFT_1920451 [Flammula alnicola]|nr:hypothetical protein BDZ97DRAFT_1930582 [Flammula alnicola]KAF8962645.1 hypothetical protein BDZ97DRAFT_1920451 [Flammula alnicola]
MARDDFLRGTTWFSNTGRSDSLYEANGMKRRICEVVAVISTDDHCLSIRGDFDPDKHTNIAAARLRFCIQSPNIPGIPEFDVDFQKSVSKLLLLSEILPPSKRNVDRVIAVREDGSQVIKLAHRLFELKKSAYTATTCTWTHDLELYSNDQKCLPLVERLVATHTMRNMSVYKEDHRVEMDNLERLTGSLVRIGLFVSQSLYGGFVAEVESIVVL